MGSTKSQGDRVKKNSFGGVLITPEEISLAFKMLDADKSGQITLVNLKKRLGVLFPELTVTDYRFLMNNKKEMSLEDLNELLLDNDVVNFDPVAEAFKVFDPTGEGVVSGRKLREAFVVYGMGELTEMELDILIKTADMDGDGSISLEDFRCMIDQTTVANAKTSASAKTLTDSKKDDSDSGSGGF
ncbi:hypothetical protein B484DRAFT_336170 [Ochromonadaceae sp. CCMP2298]|nr:hypothetical protein B484DRAFT_336170 [Ochromonadaceae sp. CCMP2298]